MRNQQKTPLASPIAVETAMRHRMEEFVPISLSDRFCFGRFCFDQL
jgi:hypothetical protein